MFLCKNEECENQLYTEKNIALFYVSVFKTQM